MQCSIMPQIQYIFDRSSQISTSVYCPFIYFLYVSQIFVISCQARSIQELAKKDFENLRQDSDDNEPEPKVVRRGRPPTKNLKKPVGRPSLERAASEFSSDATLATGGENATLLNHDMRKGSLLLDRSGLTDSSGRLNGSRNNDVYGSWLADNKFERNDEYTGLKRIFWSLICQFKLSRIITMYFPEKTDGSSPFCFDKYHRFWD